MGKPLNWMLSGSPARKQTSRALRERLAATTILAVVPFLGYGRQAYADCVLTTAPNVYTCSGTSAGENFTGLNSVDNADFQTAAPPFVVTTSGVAIEGLGDIRFTDHNSSSITNRDGPGLSLRSSGNYYGEELVPGAVTIDTNATITGYNGDGIYAHNSGNGDINITADGRVSGYADDSFLAADGIYAKNFGRDLTITTGAHSDIFGTDNGIDARNLNYEDGGNLVINADGYVTGYYNDGIHALNRGLGLSVTTGEASVVRGGGHGIGAVNTGNGDLTIEANGWVAGYGEDADGIYAYNLAGSYYAAERYSFGLGRGQNLIIRTGENSTVLGSDDGIHAINRGQGELSITADGYVRGKLGDGIYAVNAYGYRYDEDAHENIALMITTGAASTVIGDKYGIYARNHGDGTFNITADGEVTGYGADGIHAKNGSYDSSEDGRTMTITTGAGSTVTGHGDDGINAYQYGSGNLVIDVGGSVTGVGNDTPGEDAGSFGIEAWQATSNPADDSTQIKVQSGGLVQGKTGGIYVRTLNNDITITNEGTIRNLSGESGDLAIRTYGEDFGDTHVVNDGNLIGRVEFWAFDGEDTLDNSGFWNMAGGDSDFGGSYEDEINNTGVLVAADDSANQENTHISGLEYFYNTGGLISLLDGQAGDVLEMEGTYDSGTYYEGTNGHLAVDAALGPGSSDPVGDRLSDQLIINGETYGLTTVHVNVVSANGANTDGIPVVIVHGYTSGEDFKLDGPVSGGFFTWDMRFDGDLGHNWYELYTVTQNGSDKPVLGAGAFEFPAGFAATQDIWLQTIGTALHRQADLRSLLQGLSVTPVADYSEPVEPTPIVGPSAIMAPGFWFKGFGAYVERNDEQNGYDLDQNQTMYGGMAGFDFGTKEAFANAWLFGVFGGYIGSDLKFEATNTKWNFEGPTVGAYVTYLDQAFYADATVKADFLDIKINPDKIASEVDDSHTNAVNVGGRLDTGYRFGHAAFVEPQASLAVVHTEVDNVDIYGGTVEFDDDTSVRGRLGMRLGVEHTHTDNTVYSADVTGSVWENFTGGNSDVTVTDTGLPDFGVSDNQESTYGDVSLGLSVANPDGWSSFVRGNYTFANDYEAWVGNAGVRFVW